MACNGRCRFLLFFWRLSRLLICVLGESRAKHLPKADNHQKHLQPQRAQRNTEENQKQGESQKEIRTANIWQCKKLTTKATRRRRKKMLPWARRPTPPCAGDSKATCCVPATAATRLRAPSGMA